MSRQGEASAHGLPRVDEALGALGALGASMNFLTISWDVGRGVQQIEGLGSSWNLWNLLRLKIV